jgi:ornithine decarboxylase
MNTLTLDLAKLQPNYENLQSAFPRAKIYYAVKANPNPEVIKTLITLGSSFDIASKEEFNLVHSLGAKVENISFGNPVKTEDAIRSTLNAGVSLYSFDSREELDKIRRHGTPSVICRIRINEKFKAQWPLTKKFGCEVSEAIENIEYATAIGLNPIGVSFHVGSQQLEIEAWKHAIEKVLPIYEKFPKLTILNIGGGFPVEYTCPISPISEYGRRISEWVSNQLPRCTIFLEPGRYMTGNIGTIETSVVLFAKRKEENWVYLNTGVFGGLMETLNESIKYRLEFPDSNSATFVEAILAGPTCDSTDIMYTAMVPETLKPGERIRILNTGAYTYSYCSICFNGFPELDVKIL